MYYKKKMIKIIYTVLAKMPDSEEKKWTICLVEENKAVARDIFVVTPESLCFHSDGGVEISESPSQTKDSRYLPPDLQHAPIKILQAAEKVSLS